MAIRLSKLRPRTTITSGIVPIYFRSDQGEDGFIDEQIIDSFSVSDEITLEVEYERTLSDSTSVFDEVSKTIELNLTDTVALHDEAVRNTIKNRLVFTDTISKTIDVTLADGFGLSDTSVNDTRVNVDDTVTMSDSQVTTLL